MIQSTAESARGPSSICGTAAAVSAPLLQQLLTGQRAHRSIGGVPWVVLHPALTRRTVLLRGGWGDEGGGGDGEARRLVEENCLRQLTSSRVINWCRTTCQLVPLKVESTDEPRSLLQAVSTALWGLSDIEVLQFLRQLICAVLTSGSPMMDHLRARLSPTDARAGTNSRGSSWTSPGITTCLDFSEVFSAFDNNASGDKTPRRLSPIHIYVFSNILRRTIVVLQAPGIDNLCDFEGVYLPLDSRPNQCVRLPLVLVHHEGHFLPLVAQTAAAEGEWCAGGMRGGLSRELTVPLVGSNMAPLRVRCLKNDGSEEATAADLLLSYLQLKEVPYTTPTSVNLILVAELCTPKPSHTVQPYLSNQHSSSFASNVSGMVRSLDYVTEFRSQALAAPSPAVPPGRNIFSKGPLGGNSMVVRRASICGEHLSPEVRSARFKCRTSDCSFYGSVEFKGLCSSCFESQWQTGRNDVTKHEKRTANQTEAIGFRSPTYSGKENQASSTTMDPIMGSCALLEVDKSEAKQCMVKGCDMFGLPENGFHCSSHLPWLLQPDHYKPATAAHKQPVKGIFKKTVDERVTNNAAAGENLVVLSERGLYDSFSARLMVSDQTGSQFETNGTSSSQPLASKQMCTTCQSIGIGQYNGHCRDCYLHRPTRLSSDMELLQVHAAQGAPIALASQTMNTGRPSAALAATGRYFKTSAAAAPKEGPLQFMVNSHESSECIAERARNRASLLLSTLCPFGCGKVGSPKYNGLCSNCFDELDPKDCSSSYIDVAMPQQRGFKHEPKIRSVHQHLVDPRVPKAVHFSPQPYYISGPFAYPESLSGLNQHEDSTRLRNDDVRLLNNDVTRKRELQRDVTPTVACSDKHQSPHSNNDTQLQQILTHQQKMLEEANRARLLQASTAESITARPLLQHAAFCEPEVQREFERLQALVVPAALYSVE